MSEAYAMDNEENLMVWAKSRTTPKLVYLLRVPGGRHDSEIRCSCDRANKGLWCDHVAALRKVLREDGL